MQNQSRVEEKSNEVVKKSWVEPEMVEVIVNTGAGYGPEASFAMS